MSRLALLAALGVMVGLSAAAVAETRSSGPSYLHSLYIENTTDGPAPRYPHGSLNRADGGGPAAVIENTTDGPASDRPDAVRSTIVAGPGTPNVDNETGEDGLVSSRPDRGAPTLN